jgi:hypothetical protein
MNLIDARIEMLGGRLKRIDENPDPTKLRSNRLGYELELKKSYEVQEAWRKGNPISMGIGGTLAKALGFQKVDYPLLVGDFPQEVPKYLEVVRDMGWPEHICEFVTLGLAAATVGDAPPLSLLLAEKEECTVATYAQMALTEHFNVPLYMIDDPLDYNEESIKYVADQLGEFIEFAESKIPGIKYDRDRHLEVLELARVGYSYIRKEWELRKLVPLPMTIWDSFQMPMIPEASPEGAEYLRIRVEEIEERAAKGLVQEEKLRALWIWVAPFYTNFLGLLESKGVAIPHAVSGGTGWQNGRRGTIGDEKEFGRKLSPLEEEARMQMSWSWRSRGRMWEDEILFACQDLKCDAIIYFQFTGCKLTSHPARIVADRAEKELGVPTFIVSGRSMDPTSLPAPEFESRLSDFIDMVLAQKGQD